MIYARAYMSKEDYEKNFTTDCIFDSMDDLMEFLYHDETTIDKVLPFTISGKTYAEKQSSLRSIAQEFQTLCNGGLSYGELFEAESFFRENGKRYGLLEEFESECIC